MLVEDIVHYDPAGNGSCENWQGRYELDLPVYDIFNTVIGGKAKRWV